MKLTFGLLLITMMSFAVETFSQSARINLQAKESTIVEIFQKIEETSDVGFFFKNDQLDLAKKYTVNFKDESIEDVLNTLLGKDYSYRYLGNTVVITLKADQQNTLGQQQKTITGNVTDSSGAPLPGVTVVVKGTTQGTVTDEAGNYSLPAVPGDETLVFSFVGMRTQEIPVSGQTTVNVVMAEEAIGLDEVVAVGYGTVRKRDLISSVSKVDAETLKKTTTSSFTTALQGVASGVQVSSTSGEPGAATRILVRGVSSITTATEPLVIVDGLPVASGGTSPLSYLSPQDIENISVLKDASATAIYGSRGSNGVILITTKTGKSGQKQLNLNVEKGITMPINEMELANAGEWRGIIDLARKNSGLTDRFKKEQDLVDQRNMQRYVDLDIYNSEGTDWVDLMQQNGSFEQYTLSASNGVGNTSYFISGQYRKQEGNFMDTKYERFTGRMNLDFDATDFLKLGLRYSFIYNNDKPREWGTNSGLGSNISFVDKFQNKGLRPVYGALYSALPIFPEAWPDDGSPFDRFSGLNLTYLSDDSNAVRRVSGTRNIGSMFAELTPVEGLILRGEVGVNYSTSMDKNWSSVRVKEFKDSDIGRDDRYQLDYIYEDGVPRTIYLDDNWFSYNLVGTANYSRTFAEVHNFSALLGVEKNYEIGESYYYDLQNVGSIQDPQEIRNFIRDAENLYEITHSKGPDTRFYSQFGRLSYNYNSRYYLQASMRYDGSSRFTPDDRFSWFPSVSGAWVVSDETFWKENVPVLTYLKIRSGWGITGNANIGSFQYLNKYDTWANYPNFSGAMLLTHLGSKTIRWEKSETLDFALDFGLLDGRVNGSVGYYQSATSDLLLTFPIATSLGVYKTWSTNTNALDNVGSMQNHGVELEINSTNILSGNFKWTTSFNLTTNKNKVIKLYPGFNGDPLQFSFNGITTVQEGGPLGQFYLPEYAGLDDSGNVLIKEIDQEKADQGIYEFTGNVIRNTGSAANDNSIIHENKTGLPTVYGGLTNTITYKNLSLSFLLTFQGGHYIYDAMGLRRAGNGSDNFRKDLVDNSWTPENPDAKYPVLMWNNLENNPEGTANNLSDKSSYWLEKGDMLRLRNVTLNYEVPEYLVKKTRAFAGISFYVNLENVATFSKFNAVDPEVVNTGGAQDRNIGQGVVGGVPYWQVFTAVAGVNVKF